MICLENIKGDIQENTSLMLVISPFFSIILFASLAFAEMESPSSFYKTRLWPGPSVYLGNYKFSS